MDDAARRQLARKRLVNVLLSHGAACARTLEQKIADAGPNNQRIDPHVLTPERNGLVREGILDKTKRYGVNWFFLTDSDPEVVDARIDEQGKIYRELHKGGRNQRIGDCLEIAIYRALKAQDQLEYFGSFPDLDKHDDSQRYKKIEPPNHQSDNHLKSGKNVDFIVYHRTIPSGSAAIEAKNIREWLYPDRREVLQLLQKALTLNCVPVMISRRIPFVTLKVLNPCGILFHQTYNQLFPEADRELAEKVKHKKMLGFHDIRIGNEPDSRLMRFIGTNLPNLLPEARQRFEHYKDLLSAFSFGDMSYKEFAARVRRREQGQDENFDPINSPF